MRTTQIELPNAAHETLEFFEVRLSVPALLEMLVSRRDRTWLQLSRCATWYMTQAQQELYPTRKALSCLTSSMRRSVIERAIEMVLADSKLGISRP